MHFVSGGFSGSTNVAKEIIKATNQTKDIDSYLVLRQKKSTTPDKVEQFNAQGIDTRVVSGALHLLTIYQLYRLCKELQPDILLVHGFSEHLWGRYAGLLAKVPHLIHVEHNSRERYSWLRLKQAKWLTKYTDKIVGCSEGVESALLARGFPASKVISIANGINPLPYQAVESIPFEKRKPHLIMASRFARQKDHASLISALAILKNRGTTVNVSFAGLGNKHHLATAKKQVQSLGLEQQVDFLGHCTNLPELLQAHQIFVLSTHYEGMPLVVIEAMMSGCAVIASDVVGVKEMFEHKVDGYLVEPQSPLSLADGIEKLIRDPKFSQLLSRNGHRKALKQFTIEKMASQYQQLFRTLIKS
ncbi:glycosyltransferase [Paraglaciecola aquimarina]|uniref:Glycosyltransferase n=1 Tax=Paraglaciecola aquimarina TaxID=1235557 RepID=A0ABU3STX6_9ALTE|nr:glycosyltransferase [Paraglaciecola aquimarina]MDU0353453.1 glycosyltransferase [Paraglaciecola aquimarina]